jgi:hypothetical protein
MAARGAAAAAIVKAIKASGVPVNLDPAEFLKILGRVPNPLVVAATGGLFTKNYKYLMGYKGLALYTKSAEPLQLPSGAEVIAARSLWTPN